jgi:magnesium chelatase subunit H
MPPTTLPKGALAKRRGAATLVSYLTPSLTHSGLYKGLVSLQQSMERWQQMAPTRPETAPAWPS